MYKTSLLPLAAFLRTVEGLEFKGADRSNPSKIEFLFEPEPLAEKSSDEYFSGNGKSNPLELFKNHRALKDLIFEIKRNNSSKTE